MDREKRDARNKHRRELYAEKRKFNQIDRNVKIKIVNLESSCGHSYKYSTCSIYELISNDYSNDYSSFDTWDILEIVKSNAYDNSTMRNEICELEEKKKMQKISVGESYMLKKKS